METIEISIIVPVYDESASLRDLMDRIFLVMREENYDFEVIAIDDGSEDDSFHVLSSIASGNKELRLVQLTRNFGQTAALMAGINFSRGRYVVAIDSDLQNDPTDIPRIVEKLDEGFDVVSGWRVDRQDAAIRRNLPSRFANWLISRVTGVKLNDFGCTLKGYKADLISKVKLYGEMHRFIPIYATLLGGKVTEIPVKHHARRHGRSKYGLERVFKVVFDLIVLKFMGHYFAKPMYLFGSLGVISLAVSLMTLIWMSYLKFFEGLSMIQTPLPVLSAISFLMGIMSFLIGLVAEILVRTYYESQRLAPYFVKTKVNFSERPD